MIPAINPIEPVPIYSPQFEPDIFGALEAEMPSEVSHLPLGDILFPYQSQSIKALDDHDVVVIEKSRRIGLTWGIAPHAVLTAATKKSDGGMDVFYMGYEKDMARDFIQTCGMWAKALNLVAGDIEEFIFEKDAEREIKAFRITFASGFEIVALPSKPRAFRGKQGLVILDEAAFMDDVQSTIDAAIALLIWGGKIIIISTHYGVDNPFNILCQKIREDDLRPIDEQTGYKLITITFDDAVSQGLYERVKLVSRKKEMLPKEEWVKDIRKKYGEAAAQELDCIPMQGGASWLAPEDIAAAVHPDAAKPELYTHNICFMGYDVARRRDYSVILTLEKCGESYWLRKLWFERGKTFEEQYAEFGNQMRFFKVAGAGIDQTGMGEAVVEHLQSLWGSALVNGILMTGPNRISLATDLRDLFEKQLIKISNDNELRADLLALKRAGREGKALMETSQRHADIFWALAFAAQIAKNGSAFYEYISIGQISNDLEEDAFALMDAQRNGATTRHGMTRGGF